MMSIPRRVLVVEDNVLLAADLIGVLEEMGYRVLAPAHTLREGLDAARGADFDFALLDFDLGNGTDSTPIVEALDERGVGYAFVTASSPDILHEIFRPASVLSKPVQPLDLARALPA